MPNSVLYASDKFIVKMYLHRHYHRFCDSVYPEQDLVDICFEAVTEEDAHAWFKDCGYL